MARHKMIFRVFLLLALTLPFISGCGSGGGEEDLTLEKSVTLAWDTPALNSDGTILDDLAGFTIYYGQSSQNYSESIDAGDVNDYTVDNLTSGMWCFSVTAYDASGNESDFSNEVCMLI